MLYSKLLLLFGVIHSNSVIPFGQYCYTPNHEKNKASKTFAYHIIPCKYYKTLGKKLNGCKYLGIITNDFIFDDQCKMCNENYGDDADDMIIDKIESTNNYSGCQCNNCTGKIEYYRVKLGIEKYGYDSDFRREYECMTATLRHHELNEFFDEWQVPKK
jgi:hypothetical protein